MSDKLQQPVRFWDWRSAALTVALIQIAALRLTVTDWTPFLSATQALGFLGAALGFALGSTILYPRTARGFALAYGLLLIPAQLLAFVERTERLWYDLDLMLFRLFDAVVLLINSEPVYDPLFFVTLVAIGFWGVGVYSGYQLTRNQNLLGASLPAGVIMLVVQAYDPQSAWRAWLLAIYVFVALILTGRLYFLQSRAGWKAQRVFFTSDVEGDVSRVGLTFAAIAICAAWIFPNALNSVGPAAKAWNEFTQPLRDRFSDAVSALDSPKTPVTADFYGSKFKLGSSAPLGDTPVFFVTVDHIVFKPERYYWRGRAYDRYLNGQWTDSQTARQNFNPAFNQLQPEETQARTEAQFTITLNFPQQELLYAPPEMVWTNRAGSVVAPVATVGANVPADATAWLAAPKLSAGEAYKVRAQIANPSIEELRAAGAEYPQWVKERYLQIPPELEPKLKELAERVAAGQATSYDQAQAVTLFLRNEIKYALQLDDSPPAGEDPVTWVLFEYKKGFCVYSASAEVLLLRSLGVPARMAVGFAQGEYEPLRGRYSVKRLNSHAWPEVYFPNIGWVEFEPTGNQNRLDRPNEPVEPEIEEEPRNPRERPLPQEEREVPPVAPGESFSFVEIILPFLYPASLIALLAAGIFVMQRYSIIDRLPVYLERRYLNGGRQPPRWLARWAKWARLLPIQRAFHAVDFGLRWLDAPQPAYATPRERALVLAGLLPEAREALAVLQEEHEAALFTDRPGNVERARRAGSKIRLAVIRAYLRENLSS